MVKRRCDRSIEGGRGSTDILQTFDEFVREERLKDRGSHRRVERIGHCSWRVWMVDGCYTVEALISDADILQVMKRDHRGPIEFRVKRIGPGLLRGNYDMRRRRE